MERLCKRPALERMSQPASSTHPERLTVAIESLNWLFLFFALGFADSGDCGHGFRLNATMQSDRRRPPVPTKAAGVSLPT
jgi:hypothetical protein